MVDERLARIALQGQLLTAVFATTGVVADLSASASKFIRATGSFIADGFEVGMEITATGFVAANNAARVVKNRSALELEVTGPLSAQALAASRSITAGVPVSRAWDNIDPHDTWAPGTRPRIADRFVPATAILRSFPAQGGLMVETGLYIVTYYGLWDKGDAALRRASTTIKRLFTPGTNLTAGTDTIRIRGGGEGEPATQSGEVTPLDNGWAYVQVTVPWWAMTINAVAGASMAGSQMLLEDGDWLLLEDGFSILLEAA